MHPSGGTRPGLAGAIRLRELDCVPLQRYVTAGQLPGNGRARFGAERVADSGVVAARAESAPDFAPGTLSIWGLWQFPRLSRCGIWGYGNRGGAPTGGSSRHVAPLGVVAAPFLPQPQFPQRAKRENCHNPRIGDGAESKQRGRRSSTGLENGLIEGAPRLRLVD